MPRVGSPPYPPGWSSIRSAPTSEGCPGIQGLYSNAGAASFPPEAGEPPSLADIFAAMERSTTPTGPPAWQQTWPTIPADPARVSIEQAPGR